MDSVVKEIADGVFAIAIWDSSWNSYNNCYLINRVDDVLMIDCCKAEQSDALVAALSQIGVDPNNVKSFIATHGHPDHVGGSGLFVQAEKWIHIHDAGRLSAEQSKEFKEIDCDAGEISGLSFTLLGHHTEGSIALFDPITHCLFCGDHICFFGDKLPSEGLVTFGDDLRAKTETFVAGWSQRPEDRSKYRFDRFIQGLQLLLSYTESRYLATGHGPILRDQIPDFLRSLISRSN